MNNKRNLLIMIITLSLVLILGSSYAYLMYTKESNNSYVINVGTLEVTFVDSKTQFLNLTNMYPMTDEEGMSLEQELVFQVKNTGNLVANYNVYIEELSTDPEFKTVIKYIVNKDNKGYNESKVLNEDKYIENNGKLKVGETSEYHVKVWLMETADNTYMNKEFKAKVIVEGNQNLDKEVPLLDTIKEAIQTHTTDTCNPTITDNNDTIEDTGDDTIYFSGTNDCVNFNYVWYSGKLWRITAINPDGSMKLITQDAITTIVWNDDMTIYDNSWIYQWLNEDFKDTLYNYEKIIVQDANWNASMYQGSVSVKPPIDDNAIIVKGDVGLLNTYEYYQSYRNLGTDYNVYKNGYLNIGYYWWLITPTSFNNDNHDFAMSVHSDGIAASNSQGYDKYSVRPSINLKANIGIVSGGDGSETNPYRINGDKEPGNSGEFINTRISGEYVEVDNKKYRIVGIDKDDNGNNITKLTSVDYVRDGDTVLTKNFGSNVSWKTSVEIDSDDNYWSYYLNNTNEETIEKTWLTKDLMKYITSGTYYLGTVGVASYKNSICSESNTNDPTSSCEKTSSKWQGLVGLPRIGEMFSAQLKNSKTIESYWILTPSSIAMVDYIYTKGISSNSLPKDNTFAVRPSIYLKPEVIITGGDGMSLDTAYTIGL